MMQEGESSQVKGRLLGFSLAYLQRKYEVPKATFYRAVTTLIDRKMISKQRRGYYLISNDFRVLCNEMKNSESITS